MEVLLQLWLKFQVFIESNLGISMDTFLIILGVVAVVIFIIGLIKKAIKLMVTIAVISLLISMGSTYFGQLQEKLGIYINTDAKAVSIELDREDPDYTMDMYFQDKLVKVVDTREQGEVELYSWEINSLNTYKANKTEDGAYISVLNSSSPDEPSIQFKVQDSRADLVEKVASGINTVCSIGFKSVASDIESLSN